MNNRDNLTMKINDVRKLSDDKKNALHMYGLVRPTINPTNSSSLFASQSDQSLFRNTDSPNKISSAGNEAVSSNLHPSAVRKSPSRGQSRSKPVDIHNQERPPSRMEISALENELETNIRIVLEHDIRKTDADHSEFVYQPQKESMELIRDRMLNDMGASIDSLVSEPWLSSFIKCECLKQMCDNISSKLSDMLSVSSSELGVVLRKLRITYKQSFEQMHQSWKELRRKYLDTDRALIDSNTKIQTLREEVRQKENQVRSELDQEIARLNEEFNAEKARDKEILKQTEFKMDQMSDTLKYLNGIFKTMQSDATSVKSSDLMSKTHRLEKENKELSDQNTALEMVRINYVAAEKKIKVLEGSTRQLEDEVKRLKIQLQRRDEVVNDLMEKEALRNAEIEKLQKITKLKEDELAPVDLEDPATSVLCIKCKKSLDDLSNIKAAVMGDPGESKGSLKYYCESFRILLPNIKGRKPNRPTAWLRSCMRCILMTKMKEDVSITAIKGEVTKFPSFTYAWFLRDTEGLTGPSLSKALTLCDEDRWGFYYGLKALRKEDPEATLFWTLLDDSHGEDGTEFVLHCMSVIISIGGKQLWRQFGSAILHGGNVNTMVQDDDQRSVIWIDIDVAKEAVRLILVRALASHVTDAMDAIDALKVRPSLSELKALHDLDKSDEGNEKKGVQTETIVEEAVGEDNLTVASSLGGPVANGFNPNGNASINSSESQEASHINLFLWLRLMLQQMHADQIHRSAAIRLMFETASIGALTHDTGSGSNLTKHGAVGGSSGSHVDYPQFQSICQTLFPSTAIADIASLYAQCYEAGKHKVSVENFVQHANMKGLFTRALKLPALPLLTPLILMHSPTEAVETISETLQKKEESNISTNPKAGLTVETSRPATGVLMTEDTALKKPFIKNAKGFNVNTEETVRSKLGTIIHKKLAEISPIIRHLMNQLPEKWKKLLMEALDSVSQSLTETTQKSRAVKREKSAASIEAINAAEVEHNKLYIDGIQPYVNYRRLVLLASFVKSICDNPLIPSEFFSIADLDQSHSSLLSSHVLGAADITNHPSADSPHLFTVNAIDAAIHSAETLLGSLEQGVLLLSRTASSQQRRAVERYHSFERCRRSIIARRLQLCFRMYLSRDANAAVPRSVRGCMTPGYLRSSLHADRLQRELENRGLIRHREVIHEPWWGQHVVAAIYSFKCAYDFKAVSLGLKPITLPHAVMAYHYITWGSMEVADRMIQDLFVCIRAYRLGVPRLRIFSAFLGESRDMEEELVEILKSSHAVYLYFNLLFEVHNAEYTARYNLLHEGRKRIVEKQMMLFDCKKRVDTEVDSIRSQIESLEVKLTESAAQPDDVEQLNGLKTNLSSALAKQSSIAESMDSFEQNIATANRLIVSMENECRGRVDCLFPSSEHTFSRLDKRDVWSVEPALLLDVVTRWAKTQKYLAGHLGAYSELIDKLKTDGQGLVEVDDFLWIVLLQWAKLEHWAIKRSTARSAMVLKDHPITPHPLPPSRSRTNTPSSAKSRDGGGGGGSSRTGPIAAVTRGSYPSASASPLNKLSQNLVVGRLVNNNNPSTTINGVKVPFQKPSVNRYLPVLPITSLKAYMESIYRPGEGTALADPMFYASEYVYRIGRSKDIRIVSLFTAQGGHPSFPPITGGASFSAISRSRSSGGGANGGSSSSSSAAVLSPESIALMNSRFANELQRIMRESVLWDTTQNSLSFPIQTAAEDGDEEENQSPSHKTALYSISNTVTSLETALHPTDSEGGAVMTTTGQTKTVGDITKRTPFPTDGKGTESVSRWLTTIPSEVNHPTNPELSYMAVKKACVMYGDQISSTMLQLISPESRLLHNMEVERKVQTIRQQLLTMNELLASKEAIAALSDPRSADASSRLSAVTSGHNSSQTPPYPSLKLYSIMKRDLETASFVDILSDETSRDTRPSTGLLSVLAKDGPPSNRLGGYFDRLVEARDDEKLVGSLKEYSQAVAAGYETVQQLLKSRTDLDHLSRSLWSALQSVVSSTAELMISIGEEFPKDPWQSGAKIHVDRALVYNIPTKSSVSL